MEYGSQGALHFLKDWFYIEYDDGYIESFIYSNDLRSKNELEQIEKNKTLCLK